MRPFVSVALLLTLSLPAGAASVFPADFCATLPALDAGDQAKLWERMPELKGAPAKKVDGDTARGLIGRAVAQGLGALEVFTDDAIRADCAYVITGDVVAQLDKDFELFLLVPFSGTATDGKPFKTTVLVFGRGKLFHFYDRAGIKYKHPHFDDTFSYEQVVREATPEAGRLDLIGVHGPMGLSIDSLRQLSQDKVEVKAGPFKVTRPLRKIVRKSLPSAAFRLPTPARLQAWFEGKR